MRTEFQVFYPLTIQVFEGSVRKRMSLWTFRLSDELPQIAMRTCNENFFLPIMYELKIFVFDENLFFIYSFGEHFKSVVLHLSFSPSR